MALLGGPLRHRRADRPRQPVRPRRITGVGTFIGGILHTLPFLIPDYHVALVTALVVVGFELLALACAALALLRRRASSTSLAAVTFAGAVIVAVSVALGASA